MFVSKINPPYKKATSGRSSVAEQTLPKLPLADPYLAGTEALIHDRATSNWKMMENAIEHSVDDASAVTVHHLLVID
jgi:hypothetical protein